MNTGVPRGFRSFRRLPARRPHEVLDSRSPSGVRASFYMRACTKALQAARTDPNAASNRVASANEGGAMANVPLADPVWAIDGSTQRFCRREARPRRGHQHDRLFQVQSGRLWTDCRVCCCTTDLRTGTGGIWTRRNPGSDAASRRRHRNDPGRRDQHQPEKTELHAGPPAHEEIAFGERKNDMSSLIDPYCAAAHRRARPNPDFNNARSVPDAARIVFPPPGDDAVSSAPSGSLAVSGG